MPHGTVLVQFVMPFRGDDIPEGRSLIVGLSALLKTAHLENPKFIGQLIEVESGECGEEIAAKLRENCRRPQDQWIRYKDGRRWIAGWNEIKDFQDKQEILWKDGGVYLITGGVGGLGSIFANEIIRQAKRTNVILTGRSELGRSKQAQFEALENMGAHLEYRRVDVTDKTAMTSLIQASKKTLADSMALSMPPE